MYWPIMDKPQKTILTEKQIKVDANNENELYAAIINESKQQIKDPKVNL